MKIIIREKEDKERDAIVENILEAYDKPFNEGITEKDVSFFIEEDDKVIGGLLGAVYGDYFEIGTLAILEEHRQKGYGEMLLKKAEEYGREQGCVYALLYTTDYQGETYYPKFGYEIISSVIDYPVEGMKVLCYRKTINR